MNSLAKVGVRSALAFRRRTIERQITSLGLVLTACVLFAFACGMVLHEASNRRESLRSTLGIEAEVIGSNSAAAISFQNEDEANEILGSLAAWSDVRRARLFLPDGRTLGRFDGAEPAQCPDLQATQAAIGFDLSWCGAVIYKPVRLHGVMVGVVAIEAGLDSSFRAMLRTVLFSLLLAGVAFVSSIPLWRRVAGRVAQPLSRLVDITEQVSRDHDYRLRASVSGSWEVDALGSAFNQMMHELQRRDERLNHELQQRRQAELRLNDMAYFDPVTGLHNRHYFIERIDQAVADAREAGGQVALLYIDLDGFKQVNDTMGHDCGDQLLREVGRRLTDALRRSDGVCRLGGDEFAVILDDGNPGAQVEAVAGKLVEALGRPYRIGEAPAPAVSASIGVCVFPDCANDRDGLMRRADSAMYWAKERGKNRYWLYHDGGQDAVSRRQQLEEAIDGALQRGEMSLVYQPQVAFHCCGEIGCGGQGVESHEVVGFEALLRWRHPVLGPISPAEFIPVAEASGAIERIGEWVLQRACRQLIAWRKEFPQLQMGVNMSARQLSSDIAVERMATVFRMSGLPAGALELELTESLLVDRTDLMLGRLERLRAAGFGLAIDDFGTGYSSLAYLDSFPITTLKIDRAFVNKLGDENASHGNAIARAIVAIGAALKAEVIAEGIETVAQAEALLELGCRRGQGYLFAKPLDEGDALALLQRVAGAGVAPAGRHGAAAYPGQATGPVTV